MATAERNDDAPSSAPVGAMGSLLRRLDMLPCTDDRGSISELKDYIYSISDKLVKLLELQDPPLTVIYWMKHARELSYDIEAYLDGLDAQTEDSINDPDAKEGDDPDDSYANMKDCINNSDDKMEYSVNDSHAEMEDNPDDSDANMEDLINDDSDNETEETVDNLDSSTSDSFCSSDYKISGFRTRAKGMIDRYEKFNLDSILNCPTAATTIVSPRPSRDMVLVGMGNQITKLISLLQPKDDNDNQLKIVSILGDEGIGKSTLIQEIWLESFKEQKIWPEQYSEVKIKRAFVQLGKKPDVRMILRSILSQVSWQEPAKDCGVTDLIQEIRRHLEQKRYFIIVDDVRSLSVWDVVGRAFPCCTFGSRVITTTSDEEVALACCSYVLEHNYVMEPLSVGDCTELFIRTVVGSGTVNLQLSNDVSDDIKRKCGGLPLAIVWTAIVMASQPEINEKLCQLETEQGLSKMEKEENLNFDVKKFLAKNLRTESTPVEILNQVLKLCYNSLPHYLKTCLLYLSLYPENYIFLKEDLVKVWMAEDFIRTSEEDKVEAAGRYFDVLVSLGLIQRMDINCNRQHHQGEVAEDNEEEYPLRVPHVVHPKVFDFITCKSTEDNFITIIDCSQLTVVLKEKIRRLSLHFGSATYASTPVSIGLSHVRTLSFKGLLSCKPSLVDFKLVRVLILHLWDDDGDKKFPLAEICKLLLLKYLQVRCNVAVELPGQIGCLKHLETLEINSVVTAVPSDVFHLSRLLHLRLGLKQNLTLGPVASVKAISSDELLPPMNDSSSTSASIPSVQIFELLLPICIFSRLPKWIPQLCKLSILEIVVRELLSADIDMLADLPALTALSLYVRIPTARNIVFRRGAFPVLMCFRFMCGVLSLDFQQEAMPNLRQLFIGFNVRRREKYDYILAGIQHLLNLQEVVVSIGATMGTEETDRIAAESALKDAIYKHAYPTKFIVKRVHQVEEEYRPSPFDPLSINEQEEAPVIHALQSEESTNEQPINRDKVPGKNTHEHANFREQDQWIQCDECSKWRRLPLNVIVASKWTCTDNSWDTKCCSCSAPEELTPNELQSVMQQYEEMRRRKGSYGLKVNVAEMDASSLDLKLNVAEMDASSLDALPTAAVFDEVENPGTTSVATTTKHPRHPDTASVATTTKHPRHHPGCTCNVCKLVRRRFRTLMMRKKQRQSEREEAEASKNITWVNRDESEGSNLSRYPQTLDTTRDNSGVTMFDKVADMNKGHIDLNLHLSPAARGHQGQHGAQQPRPMSMVGLLEVSSRPLDNYMKQNCLTSLVGEQGGGSSSTSTVPPGPVESEEGTSNESRIT